jgi:hypothetical protein
MSEPLDGRAAQRIRKTIRELRDAIRTLEQLLGETAAPPPTPSEARALGLPPGVMFSGGELWVTTPELQAAFREHPVGMKLAVLIHYAIEWADHECPEHPTVEENIAALTDPNDLLSLRDLVVNAIERRVSPVTLQSWTRA